MKNIVYLIDFSNIAYESIHSICGYGGKNLKANRIGKYPETKSEQDQYLQDVDERFKSHIPVFKNSSGMICVFDNFDGRTHRSSIYKEYKGKREDNKKAFDGANMKECIKKYKSHLDDEGIMTMVKSGFEADDIISIASKELVKMGYSVIIVSRDKDLMQLLKNEGNVGVYFFNTHKAELTSAKGFAKVEQNFDAMEAFFDDGQVDDIDTVFNTRIEIDPKAILLSKIISGDTSDNIPACIDYIKGSSTMKVSEGRMDTVIGNMDTPIPDSISWEWVEGYLSHRINEVVKTKKNPNVINLTKDHRERFHTNLKLIELNESIIPKEDVDAVIGEVRKFESNLQEMERVLKIRLFEQDSQDWASMKEY